jgi:hypothetical protein
MSATDKIYVAGQRSMVGRAIECILLEHGLQRACRDIQSYETCDA